MHKLIIRTPLLRLMSLSLLVASLAADAYGQSEAAIDDARIAQTAIEFARVVHDDDGEPLALQIALTRYVAGNATVDLVGAVHVGDRGYYQELNQRFRDYDAVLFELVAPEGAQDRLAEAERRGMISTAQLAMTKALGLSFQLDEIDYSADNFVHADLSPTEFAQSMVDRDESLYVYFWRMFYASINEATKDPLGLRQMRGLHSSLASGQDNPLKVAFAYEMTNVNTISGALDGGDGSAIIEARNERAIEVLQQALADGHRRVAIFYGVGHMPDFEQRLIDDLKFEYEKSLWINAWRLQSPQSEVDGTEPR